MDQEGLRTWEAKCTQEEPPPCRAGCPLDMDGRGFVAAMAAGDLRKARTILDRHLPLPGITGRLCEAPCEQFCLRRELGGSIDISSLEHYCVESEGSRSKVLRLPARAKTVLIIGSGPSALTAAFDLAKKGYSVTICHLGEEPGSWLHEVDEQLLPAAVIAEELQRLRTLKVNFRSVASLDGSLCETFSCEAVYIGQDDSLAGDILTNMGEVDEKVFSVEGKGRFTGGFAGPNHPYRFITDISQGRQAALSIDRYLQGASLTVERPAVRSGKTDLYTNTTGIPAVSRIIPAAGRRLTENEMQEEAGRCLLCECMACVNNCRFLQEYKGYPKTYVRRIYNNSAIVKGNHQANKMINSCSLCGQCEELCPNDFSMADLCLESRRLMVKEDRMPPSAHWFALEEMRSARGEGALAHHAAGSETSKMLFFPGCQLAGIRPDQTLRLYEHFQEIEPQTGIWLDCCGVPAHWAGREEEYKGAAENLLEVWQEMGSPTVVAGCATCLKMFREHLPQIKVVSAWAVLCDNPATGAQSGAPMALSDPCSTRHDEETRNGVRKLLRDIGQQLVVLPMSGRLTECCGFGGLMESSNPDLAAKTAARRMEQVEEEMLTYCAMCRDQLAKNGKPVRHLLDLLFPETAHPATEPPVLRSDRRVNRRRLKAKILTGLPDSEQPAPYPWEHFKLIIPDPVIAQMEQRRILEDDVRQVIYRAMENKKWMIHGPGGMMVASAKLGEVTFWVRYKHEDKSVLLEGCWSHRMQIVGGAV